MCINFLYFFRTKANIKVGNNTYLWAAALIGVLRGHAKVLGLRSGSSLSGENQRKPNPSEPVRLTAMMVVTFAQQFRPAHFMHMSRWKSNLACCVEQGNQNRRPINFVLRLAERLAIAWAWAWASGARCGAEVTKSCLCCNFWEICH